MPRPSWQTCPPLRPAPADVAAEMVGARFGSLLVIGLYGLPCADGGRWVVHCDCARGFETYLRRTLVNGHATSCQHCRADAAAVVVQPWWFENLWRVQDGRCHYCRGEMIRPEHDRTPSGSRRPGKLATRDHLLPRSRGGSDQPHNLVLACSTCNAKKGDRTEEEFLVSHGPWLARVRKWAMVADLQAAAPPPTPLDL